MSEHRILRAIRTQAWERAKGEMNAMLHTYYDHDEHGRETQSYFDQFSKAMEKFVQQVEDNGWQE